MMNSIVAVFALAGAAAASIGSAKVVNNCNYDVYLSNVPSANGGYTQQDQTLSPGDSWSQVYTELTNGNGWSIKLSNSTSLEHILQYEYTIQSQDTGMLWFDLSCVNGDPWPANWELSADGDCTPTQHAYYYPTDDNYGMQSCTSNNTVQLLLCSQENSISSTGSGSGSAPAYSSAPASSSAPAYSTPASSSEAAATPSSSSSSSQAPAFTPPATTAAAAAPSPPASTPTGGWLGFLNSGDGLVEADAENKAAAPATPTTLATVAVASQDAAGDVVTVVDVETAYATAIVTAFARDAPEAPGRHRRHEHHAHQHA